MAQRAHKWEHDISIAVETLSGYGCQNHQIAVHPKVNVHIKALLRIYRKELDRGKAMACAKVGETLYKGAVSGKNPAYTIFFAKTQMGWSERSRLELSGPGGGPIKGESVNMQLNKTITGAEAAKAYLQLMNDD